jgi:hypothetical protein
MKGLGTRNRKLFKVFNSLVTISDFSALISTFNEDHLNEGSGDLLEWLDDDIDISSTWNKIYVPLRNIVKKFAKQMAKEGNQLQQQKHQPDSTTSGGYAPCQNGIYTFGCQGEGINKVQTCLGGLVTDGKFGPLTKAKLESVAKQFSEKFTDANIPEICKMASMSSTVSQSRAPEPLQNVRPIPTKDQTIKSQIKVPELSKKLNLTQLAPIKKGATNMAMGFKP